VQKAREEAPGLGEKVLTGQSEQESGALELWDASMYEPAGQTVQEVAPTPVEIDPETHTVQTVDPVEGEYVPEGQGSLGAPLPGQRQPAGQVVVMFVAPPLTSDETHRIPGGQAIQLLVEINPVDAEYVPLGHGTVPPNRCS